MSKLAAAIADEVIGHGPNCSVAELLGRLPKDLVGDLNEALASAVPATAISRALVKLGHDMSASPLQRHRRGDCSCGRGTPR